MGFPKFHEIRRGYCSSALALLLSCPLVLGQDTLGLENGFIDIETSSFSARVIRDTQVLASLKPKGDEFDFLPFDYIDRRNRDGQYHWGDITYRYREAGSDLWVDGDSAAARRPVSGIESDELLAAANLAPTLPEGPLNITREWLDIDGDLALRFTVENGAGVEIELGSLGFPAEFNSIFTDRDPLGMQETCSLSDPYVGLDAGQIRVTPVNPDRGSASALVVTPLENTISRFEAYRNLVEPWFEDLAYGTQTFEGFYEWQVLTRAWAENEWSAAEEGPWNPPTSLVLKEGETVRFGLRFTLADGVRKFDEAVRSTGTPTALGIPGYILPQDLPGKLFLNASSAVSSFSADPPGSLIFDEAEDGSFTVTPSESTWGRTRLTIEYDDGKLQVLHYFITKPAPTVLADMGSFLFDEAWWTDETDVFNRTPSIMSYDYEEGAIVQQDPRVWIAGLSDEGGSGAYVAAAIKQILQPDADEVAKLDQFATDVLWGQLQKEDYSIRKSLFFYEPEARNFEYDAGIDWTSWTSWNREAASSIDRAYNYVHPAAAYWALYRVSRAYPDLVQHEWNWYLTKAWGSAYRMTEPDVGYNAVGLMGETVFGRILEDLVREDESTMAEQLEERMRTRAERWASEEVPYGSEMAWDSTGQEGVYYWSRHFGFNNAAIQTVNSVLGYMPSIPHWAWNGCARRYWDFEYAGKLRRIERQIHHYGSALNAQVLLDAFQDDPSDSYLLRVGYGGSSAPISNINQEGFPSIAYHAWPDTQKWDAYTGDYGGGFLGMALSGGMYVADDIEAGLVSYGGVLTQDGGVVTVVNKSAVKRRVYIGPLSLAVEVDAGIMNEFKYDLEARTVDISIIQLPDGPMAEFAVIWVDSRSETVWAVEAGEVAEVRGGWVVSLGQEGVTIRLQPEG